MEAGCPTICLHIIQAAKEQERARLQEQQQKKRLNREQLRCSVHLFVIEHSGSGNVGHLLEISLAYDNYANCANPKQGVLGKCLALFENGYKASKKDKYVHF